MSKYREQQCQLMLEALRGAGHGMTRRDFATLLGIRKSQHLNSLLLELTTRELAYVKKQKDIHNRRAFFYFPMPAPAPESQQS